MRIVIAGGGIGGLTLALLLRRRGFDVTVYEAVDEPKALGVGINLLPHAVRELAALDLLPRLAETAIETASLSYYTKFGRKIWSEPRGRAAGYPVPQFSIHRGELLMILYHAALAELGAARVVTGHELVSFSQSPDGVDILFNDRRSGRSVTVTADLLVGADGIHSALRRQLFPDEGPPQFSGRLLWRATTMAAPFLDGRSMFMAGHQNCKFVAYPISEPFRRDGRSLINWIAELPTTDALPGRADWNKQVAAETFEHAFRDWRWDWINIPAIIRGAEAIYEFPMVDRDPLPRWSHGRVTLLGDAAHPMYPIGSNGASQAILDARALADRLTAIDDPVAALKSYDDDRRPKTAEIVRMNRRNGPEQVMQMVEDRAPNGFDKLEDVISPAELQAVADKYKQVAGFDIDHVRSDKPPM